ncbi:hypothetical protein V498_04419 [Pseudogymnoascus sp. VKM F-4517 (FW-2822)]|nr:hypothetical protein V498_04419 [Pseudogymnoascus sp. VKM F-4517 (FW-2822)]
MNTHAMLAVRDSTTFLHAMPQDLAARVEIACVNSPHDTVMTGPIEAIDELARFLESSKIRSKKLIVPFAFHSAQVDPILDGFENLARKVDMQKPRIPIISPLRGRILGTADPIDARYLREHCRQPVQFADALRDGQEAHIVQESTVFVEIGPHPICSAMIRRVLGNQTQTLPTLRQNESPWSVMASSLSSLHDLGIEVNWAEYNRDLEGGCCLLTLPAYVFDNKNYWIDYKNDWTLRKGDPALAVSNEKPVSAARISASVHRVVEEQYNGPNQMAVFETDLRAPEVHAAICGHRVNNSGLCPASLYADIALTIARYIQQLPESVFSLSGHNVADMTVHQGLIVNSVLEEETRVLRVYAHLDQSSKTIKLEYASISPGQTTSVNHATCVVRFEDSEKWIRGWGRDLHLVQDRITSLQNMADSGTISKITTGLAYRLFSALVDYVPEYQRMDRILFDAPRLEAAATVSLDDRGTDSTFLYSPYWLDSLMHITGFVMNSNDTLDYHEAVYIAHGWEALRIAGPLSSNRNYQSYVRMCPEGKNLAVGNVWILCDGEVVGIVESVQFQRVSRTVLDLLLPPTGGDPRKARKSVAQRPPSLQNAVTKPDQNSQQGNRSRADLSRRAVVLDTIASELGVEASDISLGDQLANLGVDSLMSLVLTGKLLDNFDIEMPHTQITECVTVGQLLDLLDQQLGGSGDHFGSQSPAGYDTSCSSQSAGANILITPSTDDDIIEMVKSIIIEETGIAPKDLLLSADLGHFGVDSLMSLVIVGRLRDEGVELPSTLFRDHRTMNEVAKAIAGDRPQPIHQLMSEALKIASPPRQETFANLLVQIQRRTNPSGNSTLFLFPVGSGSPGLYSKLASISPEFDVYGLVGPFVNSPDKYTHGFEELVQLYLTAVRKHQPRGPYHFGGISMGGMFAYEAAKQMVDAGEEVASLLLIDSPCPAILPPMSPPLIDYCVSLGLFGDESKKTPEQRQKSMKNYYTSVEKLAAYTPLRISSTAQGLQILIIWAEDGARDSEKDPEPDFSYNKGDRKSIEQWILNDRTEFGPHGWDLLLPIDKMEFKRTPGNHFNFEYPSQVWAHPM